MLPRSLQHRNHGLPQVGRVGPQRRPKDHRNIRLLHSGSKAENKEDSRNHGLVDSRNHGLVDPYVPVVFGSPAETRAATRQLPPALKFPCSFIGSRPLSNYLKVLGGITLLA